MCIRDSYIPKLIEKKLQNAKNESIDSFQKHLGNMVEWLSGFELIKNYSIENVIARKFRESNKEVSDKLFRFKKVTYLSKTITALLSYMSHFIVIEMCIRDRICMPTSVTIGMSALRSACLKMAMRSLAPLARTVLMKSSRRTSSTEERVMRMTEPAMLVPRIREGSSIISRFLSGSSKRPT